MAIALSIVGVGFAAFCVWLTVRIVNRRERWAKWTLAAVVGVPVLYVASFGPACWATSHADSDADKIKTNRALIIYCPLAKAVRNSPDGRFSRSLIWWMTLGAPTDHWIILPVDVNRTRFIRIQSG